MKRTQKLKKFSGNTVPWSASGAANWGTHSFSYAENCPEASNQKKKLPGKL